MAALHVICRKSLHLHPTNFPEFESGFWDVTEDDARKLVGGRLYLHETKNQPSYFGGLVREFRIAECKEPFPGRIVFTVLSQREGKGVSWSGASHAMARNGGVLDS